MIRRHVWVSGRVQGVFFRESTRQTAEQQGVTGWVRNLPDGRVEAVLEGAPEPVAAVLAFCRRGPPHASVTGVEVIEEEPAELRGFRVTR